MLHSTNKLFFAYLLFGIAFAGPADDDKPARMAILEFETEPGDEKAFVLARLCEAKIMLELRDMPRIEAIERAELEKIMREQELSLSAASDDPITTGEMLGADLLLFGRVAVNLNCARVEVTLLETASGNELLTTGAEIPEPYDTGTARLLEKLRENIPEALKKREKDAAKPSAAVLFVKTAGAMRRMSYLSPIVAGVLEEAVLATDKFRLLRRRHIGRARAETEMAFYGWVKPSDAAVAARADVAIHAMIEEKYQPGLPFAETPLSFQIVLTRKNGITKHINVSGKAGKITELLVSLRREVERELNESETGVQCAADSPAIEAIILLKEALGEGTWEALAALGPEAGSGYGNDSEFLQHFDAETFNSDSSIESEFEIYERKSRLLEQALHLDPGLDIARFFLGLCFHNMGWSQPSPAQEELWKRAVREWEIFLSSDPRGELRRITLRLLAWFTDNDQRKIEIVRTYITEPPRKHMPDHTHWLPVYYFRKIGDTQALIDWFLFINEIYGIDHEQYNVRCPFLDLAAELLRANQPQAALKFFKQGMSEHNHELQTALIWSGGPAEDLLKDIYLAIGNKEGAEEIESARRARNLAKNQAYREKRIKAKENAPAPTPAMPEKLFEKIAPGQDLQTLHAVAEHNGAAYLFWTGGYNQKGYDRGRWQRNAYSIHSLFQAQNPPYTGEPLPIPHKQKEPRVTVIMSRGEHIWFGTHEGLARYHPGTGEWKWLTVEDGLPTHYILCGCLHENELWFAGGEAGNAAVFAVNPETLEMRAYPTGFNVCWALVGISAAGDSIITPSDDTEKIFVLNTVDGTWTQVACANGITPAVCIGTECWTGTSHGLAVMDLQEMPLRFQNPNNRAGRRIEIDDLSSSRITVLAADGEMLWLVEEQDFGGGYFQDDSEDWVPKDIRYTLRACDPETGECKGPLQLPVSEPVPAMQISGNSVWILGKNPLRIDRGKFLDYSADSPE